MHPHESRAAASGLQRRATLLRAGLLLASLLVCLFLAELVLAVAGFPRRVHEQVTNPPNVRLWVDQLEFQYQWNTNDRGLRYATIPTRKPAGVRRVFVVGDSFVDGEGVSDERRFTGLLEQAFPDTQFVNGGLGGQSVLQYARIFYWVGLDYHPDGLLVAVNVNDVAETDPGTPTSRIYDVEKLPATRAGRLFRAVWPRLWGRFREALDALRDNPHTGWDEGRFDVASMAAEARRKGISEDRVRRWQSRLPPEWVAAASSGRLPHYLLTWGLFRPDFHVTAIDIDGVQAQRRWEAQARLLSELVRLARERDIEVGVVFLPNLYLYEPRTRDPQNRFPFSYLGGVIREAWLTEPTTIQQRLAAWASEQAVPFLDLTDAFREAAAAGAHLQYDIDGHWNPEGHRLAADRIRDWIRREGLYRGPP